MKAVMISVAMLFVGCGGKAEPVVQNLAPVAEPVVAAPVNPEAVARIDAFLADPEQGDGAGVIELVSNDRGVYVLIPDQLRPDLFMEVIDERSMGLLIAGFVAGNARPQFVDGVKSDRLTDGMAGALKVYRALKLSTPALGEADEHERNGTLDEWTRTWMANHPNQPGR